MTGDQIRTALLEAVSEHAGEPTLQAGAVITKAAQRLGISNNLPLEQALLNFWSDLFRDGYLAWGYNLNNINPPFCHLTDHGRRFLQNLSRDPGNPGGYLAHLESTAQLNPISNSYIREALATYNSGNFKASAVMVGAAAEALALALRETLVAKLGQLGKKSPPELEDWRLKRIIDGMYTALTARKASMPRELFDALNAYWPAFTQQIRVARNEAGHPTTIEPVTSDTVHAALLIFPELWKLTHTLDAWVVSNLT